ncbi:hypothetical protein ETU08_07610 [Apibacter muscae]|uniref:hypothetical protein n=1 Tax=Apibacter muscae TaxID=2509004 RepID=UPI0011ACE464|nr:hypothetical protein [Apibacter muscae]TWP29358.1 hypothetical protein ETU08_07610 [Apibacter muscae]
MERVSSIIKKVKTISKNGIEPVQQGINNFNIPDETIEELAKKRAEICAGCEFMKMEPISFLRVKDTRIPLISEQYCVKCGCELPYKLRQSIEKCEKWNV